MSLFKQRMHCKPVRLLAYLALLCVPTSAYALEATVAPGTGVVDVAEIGQDISTVHATILSVLGHALVETDQYDNVTVIAPAAGLVVSGFKGHGVGQVDCYLRPTWSNFQSFKGNMGGKTLSGTNAVDISEIEDQFGAAPEIPFNNSVSYASKGKDFKTLLPSGEIVLWYASRGIIASFDSSNRLTRLRLQAAIQPAGPEP